MNDIILGMCIGNTIISCVLSFLLARLKRDMYEKAVSQKIFDEALIEFLHEIIETTKTKETEQ